MLVEKNVPTQQHCPVSDKILFGRSIGSRNNPFTRHKPDEKPLQQADCAINPLIPLQKAALKVSHAELPVSKTEVARPEIRAKRGDDFAGTTP